MKERSTLIGPATGPDGARPRGSVTGSVIIPITPVALTKRAEEGAVTGAAEVEIAAVRKVEMTVARADPSAMEGLAYRERHGVAHAHTPIPSVDNAQAVLTSAVVGVSPTQAAD